MTVAIFESPHKSKGLSEYIFQWLFIHKTHLHSNWSIIAPQLKLFWLKALQYSFNFNKIEFKTMKTWISLKINRPNDYSKSPPINLNHLFPIISLLTYPNWKKSIIWNASVINLDNLLLFPCTFPTKMLLFFHHTPSL